MEVLSAAAKVTVHDFSFPLYSFSMYSVSRPLPFCILVCLSLPLADSHNFFVQSDNLERQIRLRGTADLARLRSDLRADSDTLMYRFGA